MNPNLAEEIVEEWICMWHASTTDDVDVDYSIDRMRRIANGKFEDFRNKKQANDFARLFAEMYNNTRLPIYRGQTPKEANCAAECYVE